MITFICDELLFWKTRTDENEYRRRISFMNWLRSIKAKNLIEALDYLEHNISEEMAVSFARICNRSFIEKLFMFISNTDQVIRERIEVCNWLIRKDVGSRSLIQEEMTALMHERDNNEARSVIDNTRIHVNEDMLREWYIREFSTDLFRYRRYVKAEGMLDDQASHAEELSEAEAEEFHIKGASMGADFLLFQIATKTLEVFAKDREFGLDAYLSRRIRHGTLRGWLLAPVEEVLSTVPKNLAKLRAQGLDIRDDQVLQPVKGWKNQYEKKIEILRESMLQIKTKSGSDALFHINWRDPRSTRHLNLLAARVRKQVIDVAPNYNMYSDILNFCWDCVEIDLERVREFLQLNWLPSIRETMKQKILGEKSTHDNINRQIYQYLNERISLRVNLLSTWFTRPESHSVVFSLDRIVKIQMKIVKDLYHGFHPIEDIVIETDVKLEKSLFNTFNDLMFIFFENIARHGKKDGVRKHPCLVG